MTICEQDESMNQKCDSIFVWYLWGQETNSKKRGLCNKQMYWTFCFLKATDSAIRNHDGRSVAVSDLIPIFSGENRHYSHSEILYEEEDDGLILDVESESEKVS